MITDRHVGEAVIGMGNSGGEAQKIGNLTSGARGALVAMVCFGACDTFTGGKGGVQVGFGPAAMDMSQIRSSFNTMLDWKKSTGGIQIGHDPTEMNVRNWISELHDCGLIKGGRNTFGGNRSFSGGRSDKVLKYRYAWLLLSVPSN